MTGTFADRVRRGEFATDADAEEAFNDVVDVWHLWRWGGSGVPLHEFLGLTREQYQASMVGTPWRTILEERP